MTARRGSWSSHRIALAAAVMLTGASMMLYAGGTLLDGSTRGYSFAHNFLSDLGSTVAFNYQPNLTGAILFGLAVVIGVFTLGAYVVATIRVLSADAAARPFARAAAAVVVLVCAGFLGLAVTPQNLLIGLHTVLGLIAFYSFPLVTALLATATMRDNRFRTRATAGWIFLSLVLVAFVAVGHLGPSARTELGLVVQVLTQKVVVLIVIVLLWLESHETDLATIRAATYATP